MTPSPLTRRSLFAASAAGLVSAGLAACGGSDSSKAPEAKDGVTTIAIAATQKPHAEILGFVQDKLAKAAGLSLDVQVQTDYQVPNRLLSEGEVQANFFQHKPFLEEQIKEKGYKLTPYAGVEIEPLGVYSTTLKDLGALASGAEVAIPNDPTNRGRALALLADNQVITLKDGIEPTAATAKDVADNPKKLTFSEVDAALIPRTLSDFAAGIINGNYAIEAKLKPSTDALVLEQGKGNPYANMLVVRTADKDNAALKKLDSLLRSAEVKSFIASTYQDGSVIAAF